ncbi:MAG: hypothetical protein AAGI30_13700 [Planctomycetota bacterium]
MRSGRRSILTIVLVLLAAATARAQLEPPTDSAVHEMWRKMADVELPAGTFAHVRVHPTPTDSRPDAQVSSEYRFWLFNDGVWRVQEDTTYADGFQHTNTVARTRDGIMWRIYSYHDIAPSFDTLRGRWDDEASGGFAHQRGRVEIILTHLITALCQWAGPRYEVGDITPEYFDMRVFTDEGKVRTFRRFIEPLEGGQLDDRFVIAESVWLDPPDRTEPATLSTFDDYSYFVPWPHAMPHRMVSYRVTGEVRQTTELIEFRRLLTEETPDMCDMPTPGQPDPLLGELDPEMLANVTTVAPGDLVTRRDDQDEDRAGILRSPSTWLLVIAGACVLGACVIWYRRIVA